MFTPSYEQGFNPNFIRGGLPPDPFIVAPITPQIESERNSNMLLEMDISLRMDDLVAHNVLSQASASWLLQVVSGNQEETQKLLHRLTRPEGFKGSGSVIGGGSYVSE